MDKLFTIDEFTCLKNSEFFKLRHQAGKKIELFFSHLRDELKTVINDTQVKFPDGCDYKTGKISKGENYKLLPYYVLDFPRLFSKTSIYGIRTMFWWGTCFSVTLQIGGEALESRKKELINIFPSWTPKSNVFFCINSTPWEYHYDRLNYVPIKQIDEQALLEQMNNNKFIKINQKIELTDSESLKESLLFFYKQLEKLG